MWASAAREEVKAAGASRHCPPRLPPFHYNLFPQLFPAFTLGLELLTFPNWGQGVEEPQSVNDGRSGLRRLRWSAPLQAHPAPTGRRLGDKEGASAWCFLPVS